MLTKRKKPPFITFEGGEGAGKSTQIQRLMVWLKENDSHTWENYYEPGGVPEAEAIRAAVKNGAADKFTPEEEMEQFCKARKVFLEQLIYPKQEEGIAIVLDRYADSTTAYQGYGRGVPIQTVMKAHTKTFADLWPDITFILDIDPKIGLERARKRSAELGETDNRFENMDIHDDVRQGFLAIAKENPKRCYVIDANQTVENVQAEIRRIMHAKLRKAVI